MREVKPTQKPVPSSDIKDLFFNSGLLDIWATSLEHKYIDRFGNCHLTAAGMEWLFKELVEKFKIDMNIAIVAAGYITIDSFQQGADLPNNELTQRNQIVRDENTGEYYRWDGDLPKQVPAGSTPQSTGGIGKGAWVSVGDASLRSDLRNDSGSEIVHFNPLNEYSEGSVGYYLNKFVGFVTPDHFTGTDQEKIEQWLAHGGKLFLDRTYQLTQKINANVNNAVIDGTGKIQTSLKVGKSETILTITGNGNNIRQLIIEHTGDMRDCGYLVSVSGNNNEVTIKSKFLSDFNPSVEGEQYTGLFISVNGNNNTVEKGLLENGGGGIEENGIGNVIQHNTITNCCRGVVNGSKSRDSDVGYNKIDLQHKGYPLQSCDGVWGNRSHRGTKYHHNTIKNSAEHGAYLQGDGFIWDNTNIISGSKKCMIKVGAKQDGNFTYPNETLPKFNKLAEESDTGLYATCNASISPRGYNNNQENGSDGVVCLQPNIASLTIDDPNLYDNQSTNAIRSLYFSTVDDSQVMGNITLQNGSSIKSGQVILSGVNNKVNGFKADSDIVFSNQFSNSGVGNAMITNSSGKIIKFVGGFNGLMIEGGVFDAINENSGLNISGIGVKLLKQETGSDFSTGRVVSLVTCDVSFNTDGVFNINGVSRSINTTYRLPNATQSFPLQYNYGVGISGTSFNGNTVIAKKTPRPFRFNGNNSTCSDNLIISDGANDYAITITGSRVTAVGNEHSGTLRLETTSSNCFVVDRSVSDAGSNNRSIS